MKSLAELQAIKDRMKSKIVLREGENDVRVVVGMATCGIAAGARPVLNTLVEEVNANDLYDRGLRGRQGKGYLRKNDSRQGKGSRRKTLKGRKSCYGVHRSKRRIIWR